MTTSDEVLARVDAALFAFLEQARRSLGAEQREALPLLDEIVTVVRAGGKRLRPLFCYWGYRAAGGDDAATIVNAAASLELLHTFAIVHDDIMDRSPTRRGRDASHVALGGGHFGMSAAILAGDLAFVLADQMLAESGFDPETLRPAEDEFTRMRIEVIAGQYADLCAARDREADEPAMRRIALLKSGAYTVEKPLAIGALLAGGDAVTIEALRRFGRPLGEAFQLRDDVLGAFGDPSVTGKDAEADLREGKATVLVAKARALASEADRKVLDARLGDPNLTQQDAEQIRAILRHTGAAEQTETLIEDLRKQALTMLAAAQLRAEAESALRRLAERAVERDS